MFSSRLEGRIRTSRGGERAGRRSIIGPIHRIQSLTVCQERRQVFGTLSHDALPLGFRELNSKLGRETEHELLLEIEQLLEWAVLRNRGDALDHPLRAQQTPDPRGGAGIRAPALSELQLVEQRADLNALQQPEAPDHCQVG